MRPDSPTIDQIRVSRSFAGLSQRESADLIYVSRRAWQTYEEGTVPMKVGLWELYQFKTGQMGIRQIAAKPKRTSRHPGRAENLTPFTAQ